MSDMSRRIDGLSSAEKRVLLVEILRKKTREPKCFPVSFAQQRMWFLEQLEPHNSAYNLHTTVRLIGILTVEALEQSLHEIVQRHGALRTTFVVIKGQPVQVIAPVGSVRLRVVDLSSLSASYRNGKVKELGTEEAQRPFDLARGPLVRATLLRLAEEEHVLFLTMHHIVADGWSMGIFYRELSALYNGLVTGCPSALPVLPILYGDYAVWQRQWLQGEVLENQLAYWKQQLGGNLPVLELPTTQSRWAERTFHGAKQSLVLTRRLADALRDLSRGEGTTLFMTLLAAFQTLLYRYTHEEDIVVGSPIAGRTWAELEGLIGFFVNSLVLRTNLSGDPSFQELLGRVREVCLEAYAHQDLPFEKLVEELRPERNLINTPLFQVCFNLVDVEEHELALQGLQAETHFEPTSSFDLTLYVRIRHAVLHLECLYNTILFDAAMISRLLGHFQILLEGIVANPERRLSELPLLTGAERKQLLVEWNDTKKGAPQNKCVHQLFEEQAERSPDAVAVVFEDRRLTYKELNRRANQLAHYLKKRGVGPEVLVGICVERSLEMVIALLGILKAGGAYVPLDPVYPKERLAYVLEDTQAPVLITQRRLIESPPTSVFALVCLDEDWPQVARESDENPDTEVTTENLAYVIYTSGSTGKPKGVAIRHRSPAVLLSWAHIVFSSEVMAGVLASTSVCFDLSVFELFAPLTSGGKTILAQNALALPALPARLEVTLVNTVPTIMAELLQLNAIPSSVRTITLAGEPLQPKLVKQIYQATGAKDVYDLYGPSEDTTYSTYARRGPASPQTIGRPIANTQIYILDADLNPVPICVPGELYISGMGLATGYLNYPDMTGEKFIPNPFSNEPGARMYKTGDLARYLPDGNIEFLGRFDNQVKIRGYRIELGEIEVLLNQHQAVEQAVVMLRVDAPGNKQLVAYVVSRQKLPPSVSELRTFLKEKLPDFMVPSAFVFLDALPLTPNGKIDKRALPEPNSVRPDLQGGYVAPRSSTEKLVAEIWASLLKFDKVGIHDNFFDLGAHSLLAAQLVSRIRDVFKIELPLRTLFEAPTVAELAERIGTARRNGVGVCSMPIVPEEIDGDYPLSFAQERFWFLDQLEPNNLAYSISYTFRLTGPLNIKALEQSLAEIVRRHEILRTTYQLRNGKPVQVISKDWSLRMPVLDLSAETPNDLDVEIQRLFENEQRRPFNLSTDLLLRATLVGLSPDEHFLFLAFHHIAWDHWCIDVFFRELSVLYESFSAGKPSPLPDLSIQYKHYALWQQRVFQGKELENHLSYWKEQLRDSPPAPNLPTDHPRPPVQTFRGARQSLVLPEILSNALRALGKETGVTLFMTLLATFKILLHRLSGQDDIVVGSPFAGRDRSETEGLIGLFLNTLVLRTNVSGNPSFRELLTRVNEVALGAYDHKDLPFEKLLEELQPERDLSRTPLFQVFFNAYDFEEAKLDLQGLTIEPFRSHEPVSNFDLTLYVREQDRKSHLNLVYNTDLFESVTITRMLGYYQTLLEGIVVNPDQPISSYSLLTEKERNQLSTRTNLIQPTNPLVEFKKEDIKQSISIRFEQQVNQYPHQIAVSTSNHQWIYSDLNRRANQIAQILLRSCGSGEGRIGLLFEHDAPMIAAILGVLKAGKSYVPLDPNYPTERLAYLLEDSQAGAILANSKNTPTAKTLTNGTLQIINVDEIEADVSTDNPNVSISPDTLAYILYTSGSTGQPKGVVQNHRNVLHHIRNYTNNLHLNVEDKLILLSSFSFDAAVMDIFGALLNGAALFPIDIKEENPSAVVNRIIEEKITIYHSTPTVYRYLLGALSDKNDLSTIRFVVLGGEEVQRKDLDLFKQNFSPNAIFVNGLGPTESTLALQYFANNETLITGSVVPVGYPVEDVEVFLLNEAGEQAELYGEIGIRSSHVALGYWRKPKLTKAAFLPDPDGRTKRIYRTGDMGRLLPDGSIGFIGRKDSQVKIRGVRVELGEIEATLARHPDVKDVIVVAREDKSAEKRLVAYFVPKPGRTLKTYELYAVAKKKLPAYMIPSAIIMLETLPLTPNGKIDIEALPLPDKMTTELKAAFISPRTPVEQTLASIWAEILSIDQVGVHHNFFELGGHSLSAVRVISRIRVSFRVELPLRTLFEKPTVAELAEVITLAGNENGGEKALEELLAEIESLSDEEVEQRLIEKRKQ